MRSGYLRTDAEIDSSFVRGARAGVIGERSSPGPVYLGLALWLALATAAGAAGGTARSPVPLPAVAFALTVACLVAYGASTGLRARVRAIPLAALVGLHLVRFVGAWFIVLYRRGELPFAFAVPGGWGDIVVAATAAGVLLGALPARTVLRRIVVGAWNLVGLLDILFVATTAFLLFRTDPDQLAPLARLPLSLLPTFLVPLIVLSHLRIFGRLKEGA